MSHIAPKTAMKKKNVPLSSSSNPVVHREKRVVKYTNSQDVLALGEKLARQHSKLLHKLAE